MDFLEGFFDHGYRKRRKNTESGSIQITMMITIITRL